MLQLATLRKWKEHTERRETGATLSYSERYGSLGFKLVLWS